MNPHELSIERKIELIKEYYVPQINGKRNFMTYTDDQGMTYSQENIITSILSGNDTLCVLPTGSGKSLCFQAPSLFLEGITIVVTPLVSLIEDQVHNFNRKHMEPVEIDGRKIRFQAICSGNSTSMNDLFQKLAPNFPKEEIIPAKKNTKTNDGDNNTNNNNETNNDEVTNDDNMKNNDESSFEIQYKLLYISPERLIKPKFQRLLSRYENRSNNPLKISHIVLDEAHTLSQWGFQFRETYLKIRPFVQSHHDTAVISAFTATATHQDLMQIRLLLNIEHCTNYICNATRTELFPFVLPCKEESYRKQRNKKAAIIQEADPHPTRLSRLIKLLTDFLADEAPPQNGNRYYHPKADHCIVYCTTVENLNRLQKELTRKKIIIENTGHALTDFITFYHAGLNSYIKKRNTESIRKGNKLQRIIIATKAYGMGIDDSQVRLIIHYDMPRSLEDYYQEIGRGGREIQTSLNLEQPKRKPAACVMLYTRGSLRVSAGCLNHMIRWVFDKKSALPVASNVITPRLSANYMEKSYYHEYYRLANIYQYCEMLRAENTFFNYSIFRDEILKKQYNYTDLVDTPLPENYQYLPAEERLAYDPIRYARTAQKATEYISNYFKKEQFDTTQLDPLTDYIQKNANLLVPIATDSKNKKPKTIEEYNVYINDYLKEHTYDSSSPIPDVDEKELLRILRSPNELHINNTRIANILRWESYNYAPYSDEGMLLEMTEYKRSNIRNGFQTVFRENISKDSAFVHVDQLYNKELWNILNPNVIDRINAAWEQRRSVKTDAHYLYVVSPKTQIIQEVFLKDDITRKWRRAISEDDEQLLEKWIQKPKGKNRPSVNILSLFPLSRHSKWRSLKKLGDGVSYPFFDENEDTSKYFAYATGTRKTQAWFKIQSTEPLTYFDMCILDAVYSIMQTGQKVIHVRNIWALLNGNLDIRLPQKTANSKSGKAILQSLTRMMNAFISISDPHALVCKDEQFLPLTKCDDGSYICSNIPPLFKYAEQKNGQIIKVPVHLFNVQKMNELIGPCRNGAKVRFNPARLLMPPKHFRFNNTSLADLLRWFPEQYELNTKSPQPVQYSIKESAPESKAIVQIFPPHISQGSLFVPYKNRAAKQKSDMVENISTENPVENVSSRSTDTPYISADELNSLWNTLIISDNCKIIDPSDKLPQIHLLSKIHYLYVYDPETMKIHEIFLPNSDKNLPYWKSPSDEDEEKLEPWIRRPMEKKARKKRRPIASIQSLYSLEDAGLQFSFTDETGNATANILYAPAKHRDNAGAKFILHGTEKPNSLDLFVVDAICSLENNSPENVKNNSHTKPQDSKKALPANPAIRPEAVLSILTGNPQYSFTKDSKECIQILESIDRLNSLQISIYHDDFSLENENFLIAMQKYAEYRQKMLTFPTGTYIIRKLKSPTKAVMSYNANFKEITKDTTSFRNRDVFLDGTSLLPASLITSTSISMDSKSHKDELRFPQQEHKRLIYATTTEPLNIYYRSKDYAPIHQIDNPGTSILTSSIYRCMLCHYLLHRISINQKTGRERYISFKTLSRVLKPYVSKNSATDDHWLAHGIKGDPDWYYTELFYILDYYQHLGYLKYCGYIKNMHFETSRPLEPNILLVNPEYPDGESISEFTSTALYQITRENTFYYHHYNKDQYIVQFSSAIMHWNSKAYIWFQTEHRYLNLLARQTQLYKKLKKRLADCNEQLMQEVEAHSYQTMTQARLTDEIKQLKSKIEYIESEQLITLTPETRRRLETMELQQLDGIAILTN